MTKRSVLLALLGAIWSGGLLAQQTAPPLTVPATAAVVIPPPKVATNGSGQTMTLGGSGGTYGYDASGNIVTIGSDHYTYDSVSRITQGTAGTGRDQAYTYDPFGNIRTIVTDSTGATLTLGVDATSNQMNVSNPPGATNVAYGTYDGRGNMVTYYGPGASGQMQYGFDSMNMMTTLTGNGQDEAYVYTADDERIVSVRGASGSMKEWHYTVRDLGGKVLREIDDTQSGTAHLWRWKEDWIYRDGTLLAAETSGPEHTEHFHLDHLGTPRMITNSTGTQVSVHTYYPFGQEVTPGTDTETMKFTGHERDLSLDYMHARFRSWAVARFQSVDPNVRRQAMSLPQSYNGYSYALGAPGIYTDPDGREIYLQVHRVAFGGYHMSLRLEPTNQSSLPHFPFSNRNAATGRSYATIGAGPGTLGVIGNLTFRYNRESDIVLATKTSSVPLALNGMSEDTVIALLMTMVQNYKNDLPYAPIPWLSSSAEYYNSNGFIAGLIAALGLKMPDLKENTPGSDHPVPAEEFADVTVTARDPKKWASYDPVTTYGSALDATLSGGRWIVEVAKP